MDAVMSGSDNTGGAGSNAGVSPPGSESRTQLDYALHAARSGYSVFPCVADGKTPQIRRWESLATTDEAQIRRWWTKWPTANIGAAVGASGITVLDVDVKQEKRGAESLEELES